MKTIIIAGSDGFVGVNLSKTLSSSEYNIINIDINKGLDLSKWDDVKNLPHFDVFIHLANLSYVPLSYNQPLDYFTTNYLTTLHALELCRKHNAKLIYLSSYIYGKPQYLPIDEDHPINPFNPYAQSKFLSESLCEGYNRDFGTNCIILRPFNIYGPYQKGEMLIPSIINQIKQGNTTIQLLDPNPKRDYIYVTDVAKAIESCIREKLEGINTFNICSGESFSVLEITETINSFLPNKVIFKFGKSDRKNEVDETLGSYKKLNFFTGWEPKITYNAGIKKLLEIEEIIK